MKEVRISFYRKERILEDISELDYETFGGRRITAANGYDPFQ